MEERREARRDERRVVATPRERYGERRRRVWM